MPSYHLRREQWIDQPVEKVFAFFSDASNLQAITPPWLRFQMMTPTPIAMREGTRITYRIRWRFVRLNWVTEIVDWRPPHSFTDVQVRGPYSFWQHTHRFVPALGGTNIIDDVHYRLPLGPLGSMVHCLAVRRDLNAIFDYRAVRIREQLSEPSSA